MKNLRFIGMALMSIALCGGFAACSSDDDEEGDGGSNGKVNTSSVFSGGLPESVAGMSLTYNSDGTLASISGNSTKVSFEYGSGTRAVDANTVRMTVDDGYDTFTFDMTLNGSGFVKSCTEMWANSEGCNLETWEFGYNSDGQLNYMKRSEDGNEVTNITYQNGNAVKAKTVSEEDGDASEYSITYSSLENKGCVMLFDATLGVDMDEMEYAYYAGLLGKATKNLPASNLDSDGYTEKFSWTLNDSGLPTKMTFTGKYDFNQGYSISYSFNW